jgi:hypothetical protein
VGRNLEGAWAMTYVACLPFKVKEFRDEFAKTCKLENVLEIDNTENNLGIMISHNLGVKKMYETGADWLIIMSAAIRFGESGGLDLVEYLNKTNYRIVEATGVYGWHLIAFHRSVIDVVGEWDVNFTPYGYDDLDYSIRIQKAFANSNPGDNGSHLWTKESFDVSDTIMGHSIKIGGVVSTPSHEKAIRDYYEAKWGLPPGRGSVDDVYDYPFDNPDNELSYFPRNENDPYHISVFENDARN